jgi:hypothetical protein
MLWIVGDGAAVAREIALDRTYRFELQKFADHDMLVLLLLG